jgi:hypothetical protein
MSQNGGPLLRIFFPVTKTGVSLWRVSRKGTLSAQLSGLTTRQGERSDCFRVGDKPGTGSVTGYKASPVTYPVRARSAYMSVPRLPS